MQNITKTVLRVLLNQKIIGERHFPEDKLIKSKTKYCTKEEQKNFRKEFQLLIQDEVVLRVKKRTGKGSSWHISLNPKKIKDVINLI